MNAINVKNNPGWIRRSIIAAIACGIIVAVVIGVIALIDTFNSNRDDLVAL